MLFTFITPVLIRYLWQLKTVVFLYRCLLQAVQLCYHNKNRFGECGVLAAAQQQEALVSFNKQH